VDDIRIATGYFICVAEYSIRRVFRNFTLRSWRKRSAYRTLVVKPVANLDLEDLGVDGNIMLKGVVRE
jgi:hypothetical protein